MNADLRGEKQTGLNKITERITGWLWYLSALICVYRVSGANGRLQGMKPQMNADERRLGINSFSAELICVYRVSGANGRL